jgi:Uma2 family endonuclease
VAGSEWSCSEPASSSRDPDTVRAPDVAFVARARIPKELQPHYWDGPPDLAVEVLSLRDRERDVLRKVNEYLTCGAQAVWVVRPATRTVTLHHPGSVVRRLGEHDVLTDHRVLPRFRYSLTDLFAGIAPDRRHGQRARAAAGRSQV